MNKSDFKEELMVCMKEQGYVEDWGDNVISFNLHDIMCMEIIIDSQNLNKESQE